MISPEYCVEMARYNQWQNQQMQRAFEQLSDEELRKDRGAFFGSIFETANHLLWGDWLWIARFDGGRAPEAGPIAQSTQMTSSLAEWSTERFKLDARITRWAKGVSHIDLNGSVTWQSLALGREVSKPKGVCVVHLFNHQTHHRGQIHGMLSAAGVDPPVSDVPFMPE